MAMGLFIELTVAPNENPWFFRNRAFHYNSNSIDSDVQYKKLIG